MEILVFLAKYGINKTTNFDLLDIAKDLKIKVKILMRDEITHPKQMRDEVATSYECNSYIINLQTSKESGSHWVAYSGRRPDSSKDSGRLVYFDPYGIPPIKNLKVDKYSNST